MNKKGFTLVELLAVIVILAIIVIMAISFIGDRVEKANARALKVNANKYVQAVNDLATMSLKESVKYDNGTYKVSDIPKSNLKMSGTFPDSGYVEIVDYEVVDACLIYKTYAVSFENGKANDVVEDGKCQSVNLAFGYTGYQETYEAQKNGTYKLEVWGAQGGNVDATYTGGYGAYSVGEIYLNKGDKLYVNVGGQGALVSNATSTAAFNGGGTAKTQSTYDSATGGGGATSITTTSGQLSAHSDSISSILIAAGGGGGAYYYSSFNSSGGHAGGFLGSVPPAGTCSGRTYTSGSQASQSAGGTGNKCSNDVASGSFGQGGNGTSWSSGGGGGFYGGGAGYAHGSSGGSGYIGNPKLSNKTMYCYNCTQSTAYSNKTTSITCVNENPTANCAKKGNGYAKISFIKSEKNEEYDVDIYYDNGTMLKNISNYHSFSDYRASFNSSSITLGSSNYTEIYTDAVDLSKYNSVIIKRSSFTNQGRTSFAQYPERVNNSGEAAAVPSWTSLGNNYYAGDISTLTRSDLKLRIDQYNGDGSSDIYFIGFSSKTVSELESDHSFLK